MFLNNFNQFFKLFFFSCHEQRSLLSKRVKGWKGPVKTCSNSVSLCVFCACSVCLFLFYLEKLRICRGKRAVLAGGPGGGWAKLLPLASWMSFNSSLKASGRESLRAVYTLYRTWLQIEAASAWESVCVCAFIYVCVWLYVYIRGLLTPFVLNVCLHQRD